MNTRTILITEDDADINNLLALILKRAGYEVIQTYSGSEAILRLDAETPDLILLDLMLPGICGEDLIRKIRNDKNMQTPIIVISAKTALDSKITALTTGADDYVTKPFEPEEVLARVQAALRRYKTENKAVLSSVYTYKNLRLDDVSRSVTVCGDDITLTNHEYDILLLLVSNPQKAYSRRRIYETVWQNGYYGEDNTVNVHISNIRKKIAAKDSESEYIKTIWGIGFKMA